MYQFFLNALLPSQYSYLNINNIFNALILISELMNDSQREKFKEIIKLQIGLSFYDSFNQYHIKKLNCNF